ncbi:MAG: hypothetical protein IPM06_19825 [Rhizobiales bacterium]|nr:hypothetical protein [Hyphomicrobiales bacterium]
MASYQIYEFNGVALPLYNPEADHSTGSVPSTLRPSIGGIFDVYGARQRLPDTVQFGVRGTYAAGNGSTLLVDHAGRYIITHSGSRILVASPLQWLRLQVDTMRAQIGVRGTIRRRRWDDTTVTQWKTARLLSLQEKSNTQARTGMAEYDLLFETAHAAWRSFAASTVTENLVANNWCALNVTSDGNAPVTDPTITIAASGTITSIQIVCMALDVDLRWVGSVASGRSLVISCGAMSVLRAGVDAYSGFALGAGHMARGWLPLAAGINTLLVYADGPGTVAVGHYNQFI